MQSNSVYNLPITNIAYHVYNPEDEHKSHRAQAISQRAFQRIQDSYHEHEQLADLFQVELEKQENLIRERKELERLAKVQKQKSRRAQHYQHQPFLPQQHYRSSDHPSNRSQRVNTSIQPVVLSASSSAAAAAAAAAIVVGQESALLRQTPKPTSSLETSAGAAHSVSTPLSTSVSAASIEPESSGNDPASLLSRSLKRLRRHSDKSMSDVSGVGEEDSRSSQTQKAATSNDGHSQGPISTSRLHGLGIRRPESAERSVSSSPALPLTPSPRITPSGAPEQTRQVDQNDLSLSRASSPSALTTSTMTPVQPFLLATNPAGRRKRKQAIPVHPSVVDRIPGITMKIQREQNGDLLQVEILKNIEDYSLKKIDLTQQKETVVKDSQAKQDLQKIKESIESGRPGYTSHRLLQSQAAQHSLSAQDESVATGKAGGYHHSSPDQSATEPKTRGSAGNFVRLRKMNLDQGADDRSLASSTASLAYTPSNTNSTESLVAMLENRPEPLTWENFATRECVVNRILGKHDRDLELLEEIVHDAIARQQYTLQNQQLDDDRDLDSVSSAGHTPRKITGTSAGAGYSTVNSLPNTIGDETTAAPIHTTRSTHSTISHRGGRGGSSSSIVTRSSIPTRTTRSRALVAERVGGREAKAAELLDHDDLDLMLKLKRRRKIEEGRRRRRRKDSKASSIEDGEDLESGEEDEDQYSRRQQGRKSSVLDEDQEMESRPESESEPSRDVKQKGRRSGNNPADEDHESVGDSDVDDSLLMEGNGIQRRGRRKPLIMESTENSSRHTSSTPPLSLQSKAYSIHNAANHLRRRSKKEEDGAYSSEQESEVGNTSEENSDSNDNNDNSDDEDEDEDEEEEAKEENKVVRSGRGYRGRGYRRMGHPGPRKLGRRRMSESKTLGSSVSQLPKNKKLKRETSHGRRSAAASEALTHRNLAMGMLSDAAQEPVRRKKKVWSRGRNTRKEDEVIDSSDVDSDRDDGDNYHNVKDRERSRSYTYDKEKEVESRRVHSGRSMSISALSGSSHASTMAGVGSSLSKGATASTPLTYSRTRKTSTTAPASALSNHQSSTRAAASTSGDHSSLTGGANTAGQESGGRTRARARSFSSTIVAKEGSNFFESAMAVIAQKRRDTLAKKRAAKAEAVEREREMEKDKNKEYPEGNEENGEGKDDDESLDRVMEMEVEKEREQPRQYKSPEAEEAQLLEELQAQKVESSNLPKSSKSLPGRVLRRTRNSTGGAHYHWDGTGHEGSGAGIDGMTEEEAILSALNPDCTSCRLELSKADKAAWKHAQDQGEIRLPKMWGTHAILCTACRLQYLEHHFRCTACFYVPVRTEMAASGALCSRCRAGTWLMETVRGGPLPPGYQERVDVRRRRTSDISM